MQSIIALAGPTKSGKTTLARRLAASLAVPYGSFGDQVRKEAIRRGLNAHSQGDLQTLGAEMVEKDAKAFCKAVLSDAGYHSGHGLVLDGVRHVRVLKVIKSLAGDQTVELVYLDSSALDRAKRSSLNARELEDIDSHMVEQDAPKLKSIASLVLDTSKNDESAFKVLLEWALRECK